MITVALGAVLAGFCVDGVVLCVSVCSLRVMEETRFSLFFLGVVVTLLHKL
jgi:hypothetical protein